MAVKHTLLGFAARDSEVFIAKDGASPIDAQYLIRPDIQCPLSVDTAVWQSVFDKHKRFVQQPEMDYVRDVWANYTDLEQAAASTFEDRCPPLWFVAFASVWNDAHPSLGLQQTLQIRPETIGTNWIFLGYDVADEGLTSGLTNCVSLIRPHDFAAERLAFMNQINTFHLFHEYEHAAEYKSFADRWFESHAPFFVIGIWLIQAKCGTTI